MSWLPDKERDDVSTLSTSASIPEPCLGDTKAQDVVDPLDSGYILSRFGCAVGSGDKACDGVYPPRRADANGDGVVDPLDSGFVLSRFGECP